MDITPYIEAFTQKKRSPSLLYDMKTARNLLKGDGEAALMQQEFYENSEYRTSTSRPVRAYFRNKDIAILLQWLLSSESKKWCEVLFSFSDFRFLNILNDWCLLRSMQDPRHKVTDLLTFVFSQRTINDGISDFAAITRTFRMGKGVSMMTWKTQGHGVLSVPPQHRCSSRRIDSGTCDSKGTKAMLVTLIRWSIVG